MNFSAWNSDSEVGLGAKPPSSQRRERGVIDLTISFSGDYDFSGFRLFLSLEFRPFKSP